MTEQTPFPYEREYETLRQRLIRLYAAEGYTPRVLDVGRQVSRLSLLKYKFERGFSLTGVGPSPLLSNGNARNW